MLKIFFIKNNYLIMVSFFMNISYFKRSWIRYYKRGFFTGLLIMSFILVIDQFLSNPLFFNKITSLDVFLFILSTIFFGSVFCGILSLFFLMVVVLVTKENNQIRIFNQFSISNFLLYLSSISKDSNLLNNKLNSSSVIN